MYCGISSPTTMNVNSKNFDECCRTCLRDVSAEMYEIFRKGTDINIAELITLYTSIQLDMEDRLPKNICHSCFSCLMNFHEFKTAAVNADTELRENLTQINDDYKKDVAKNNMLVEIKIEDEYNQFQMENNCLDDSFDSEMEVKEEIIRQNLASLYSDISDASQREEQSAKQPNMELKCEVCSKQFKSQTKLNSHKRKHKHKQYICNICSKTFLFNYKYVEHLLTHRSDSKGELKSHGVTHTGIKSYACDECTATFTKCSSLKKHKLRHLGIKPFQCETCLMKFSSKDHLKRHTRIHTGERPYKCELCDRSFTQSGDLLKHTRAHLGNTPYKCNQCSESFRLKTELRTHISEHYISSQLEALKVSSTDQPQATVSNDSIVRVPPQTGVVQASTDKKIE